jgi:hypothetical protein
VVELLAFVGRTPGGWEARRKAWNAMHPHDEFKDCRNMRRDYLAAARRLGAGADAEAGAPGSAGASFIGA